MYWHRTFLYYYKDPVYLNIRLTSVYWPINRCYLYLSVTLESVEAYLRWYWISTVYPWFISYEFLVHFYKALFSPYYLNPPLPHLFFLIDPSLLGWGYCVSSQLEIVPPVDFPYLASDLSPLKSSETLLTYIILILSLYPDFTTHENESYVVSEGSNSKDKTSAKQFVPAKPFTERRTWL